MQLKESLAIIVTLLTTACTAAPTKSANPPETSQTTSSPQETTTLTDITEPAELPEFGITRSQILNGADGEIHYSYYIPEEYDGKTLLPMMVVMPGYDGMWFGEGSADVPSWLGFTA